MSVVATMRAIYNAQNTFRERDYEKDGRHDFATAFNQLNGLLDKRLTSTSVMYDYRFEFLPVSAKQGGILFNFRCRATCLSLGKAGTNGYFVDETGIIRICSGNFADETDPPIGGEK